MRRTIPLIILSQPEQKNRKQIRFEIDLHTVPTAHVKTGELRKALIRASHDFMRFLGHAMDGNDDGGAWGRRRRRGRRVLRRLGQRVLQRRGRQVPRRRANGYSL
ncbi:unnamed protein product [Cuscuta epithymum]|uniref:Uncharacterized protein n=1 Tax=Cuscuta epithymum TaxID=186058 RepID=A0AAV0G919_9ASTE|nr:unnamed protein product [Cuscuta epithymum]